MAQEGTKLQVNFKLADGTLVNVYANDAKELEVGLTTIQDTSALIAATSGALNNSTQRTQPTAVAYAKQALGASVVGTVGGNTCKHGDLVWRESKSDAAKPWKGWFCPSPKGTPDQCEPKFVR